MKQKKYWNNVADEKEFTTPFHFQEFSKFVSKNAVILDVGCGYGRTLEQLYQNGYRNLIGFDFAEKMIERGKNQYPYLDLRVKFKDTIDMENNSCDAVILFAVLTCIIKDHDQLDFLKDIERILKPGGILYINDFLLNTDERNISRYNIFVDKYRKYGVFELPEGAIVRHHDISWVKECTAHYEQLAFNQAVYTTMNGHSSNGYYYLGRKCCNE